MAQNCTYEQHLQQNGQYSGICEHIQAYVNSIQTYVDIWNVRGMCGETAVKLRGVAI